MSVNGQRGKRTNGPVRIDRLVRDCLGPVVARQGFGTAEILTAWPEIVGRELARRTRPERIRWPRRHADGAGDAATLVIRAEGGDALEIQHMTGEILSRVNAFLGWGAVGRISVRQAPVEAAPSRGDAPLPAPDDACAAPDRARLDRVAEPELRAALDELRRLRAGGENNST